MARGYRTGRADEVRQFLGARPGQAFTVREIARGIEHEGSNDTLAATLCTLVNGGELTRTPGGYGKTSYAWAAGRPAPARPHRGRRRSPAVPTAKRSGVARAGLARRPPAKEAAATPQPRPARRGESNFCVPLAIAANPLDPKALARERLAADLAAFERRGGQVQRLGVTRLFKPIEPTVFDQD